MSEQQAAEYYNEDGQHVGWEIVHEGDLYLADLEGNARYRWEDDGYVPLDEPEPEPEAGPLDELHARQDELEARFEAQPPVQYVPVPVEPAVDTDAIVEDWRTDEADVQRIFGYTLTDRQRREVATHSFDTGLSFISAAQDLAQRGRGVLPDLDDENLSEHQRHERRTSQMVGLLQDFEPDAPDPVSGERQPRQSEYDMSRHQDHVARGLDVLEGRVSREDAAAASYDSTDDEW